MLAGTDRRFEYQRLHGMGQALYSEIAGTEGLNQPCRIYAPVGSHEDLLAYLVRRLLENGANTSFVNRLADDKAPLHEIVADPSRGCGAPRSPIPRIPLPSASLWRAAQQPRLPLWDPPDPRTAAEDVRERARSIAWSPGRWSAAWRCGWRGAGRPLRPMTVPRSWARRRRPTKLRSRRRCRHQRRRRRTGIAAAALPAPRCLEGAADLYEEDTPRLLGLVVREAGKTLDNAMAEVREAVDFLRYYAELARAQFCRTDDAAGPDRRAQPAEPGRAAACSPASAPGTSRWRSSPGRSRPRLPPAMR